MTGLKIDRARIGFLFDDDESTPHIAASLVKQADGIFLSVPWYRDYNPAHERWFSAGVRWGDSPGRQYRYSVPESLLFSGPDGPIVLLDCREADSRHNLYQGAGIGRVAVSYAVLGGQNPASYSVLNGLRTEVEGLGTWVGLRSLAMDVTYDDRRRVTSADLHLESPEGIKVAPNLNLTIRPAYRLDRGERPDETLITERMLVETLVADPRSWEEHLSAHFALRDLLRVSSWKRLNFLSHEASSDAEPLRSIDGTSHGRQWLRVETQQTGIAEPSATSGRIDYLFSFDNLGARGVRRWIRLKEQMDRGITPLLRLLELRGATVETHFAQLGIGLEALGFLLAVESGVSPKQAKEEPFKERLRRILADCPAVRPINDEQWVADTTRIYNAVKHANKKLPEGQDMVRTYRDAVLVFRIWVTGRLGVGLKTLRQRLEHGL